jgi:hypothetical protein
MKISGFIWALLICVGANAISPSSSEAGIILTSRSGKGLVHGIGTGLIILGAVGGTIAVLGRELLPVFDMDRGPARRSFGWEDVLIWGLPIAIITLGVDAEGTPDLAQLEQSLSEKYSFIDSRESVHALATAIQSKLAAATVHADGHRTANLSEGEVLATLDGTSLTADDSRVQLLIRDLGEAAE